MEEALQFKTLVLAVWLGLFFVLERWRPAAPLPRDLASGRGPRLRRLARNGGLFVLNSVLSVGVVVPISAFASDVAIGLRPAWWSGSFGLLLDLLALELFIYWWHRANHEIPVLWRFHEIHHLDETLDTTSAFRFHFGEVFLSAIARGVVVIALTIPLTSVIIFETVLLLAALFHHSNVRLPRPLEQALSLVFITPSIHWVHHHAVRSDTDSNYGTLFSFWDRLFRSRSLSKRQPDMTIGVEHEREKPLPALVLRPFLPRQL